MFNTYYMMNLQFRIQDDHEKIPINKTNHHFALKIDYLLILESLPNLFHLSVSYICDVFFVEVTEVTGFNIPLM